VNAIVLEGVVKQQGAFVIRVPYLAVPAGMITGLVGGNGAGKSTLLSLMGLIERPEEGIVTVFGEPVWPRVSLAVRRSISLLLQETVLFSLSVRENIAYGLRLRRLARNEIIRRADAMMARLSLTAVADRYPRELSGGEARRVAFARAAVIPARVYLFDEPFANADETGEYAIEEVMRELLGEGATVVFTSHDRERVARLAHHHISVEGGRAF